MKNIDLNPHQDQTSSLRKSLEYQGYTPEEIRNIIFEELIFTLSQKDEKPLSITPYSSLSLLDFHCPTS